MCPVPRRIRDRTATHPLAAVWLESRTTRARELGSSPSPRRLILDAGRTSDTRPRGRQVGRRPSPRGPVSAPSRWSARRPASLRRRVRSRGCVRSRRVVRRWRPSCWTRPGTWPRRWVGSCWRTRVSATSRSSLRASGAGGGPRPSVWRAPSCRSRSASGSRKPASSWARRVRRHRSGPRCTTPCAPGWRRGVTCAASGTGAPTCPPSPPRWSPSRCSGPTLRAWCPSVSARTGSCWSGPGTRRSSGPRWSGKPSASRARMCRPSANAAPGPGPSGGSGCGSTTTPPPRSRSPAH